MLVKKKAIIFGCSAYDERQISQIEEIYDVIAIVDNNPTRWGEVSESGFKVFSPDYLLQSDWEIIVIASMAIEEITQQLVEGYKVDERKIDSTFMLRSIISRNCFLKDFAEVIYQRKIEGCVAEAGVYKGDFAAQINRIFYDRKLYLFDTFEGFDARDVQIEQQNNYSHIEIGHLHNTSIELVKSKMKYPDNVEIRPGYFPDSAGFIDNKFVFVNLDMDMYKPTLSGLEFFWPKMVEGGIIVIHDYFNRSFSGVKRAVDTWLDTNISATPFPIGDSISIAVQKC